MLLPPKKNAYCKKSVDVKLILISVSQSFNVCITYANIILCKCDHVHTGFAEAYLVGWLAFLVCFLFFHFYLRLVSPSLPSYSGETKLATSNVTLFPHFSLGHAIFLAPGFCCTGLLRVDGCSTELWLHHRQVIPIIQIAVDLSIPMVSGIEMKFFSHPPPPI